MDPRVILDDLAARGVTVRLVEGRLAAGPPAVVTPEIRETILRHRAGLVGALEATVDLRPGFETAIRQGALVVCDGCLHFEGRPGHRPDGWCRRHDQETWRLVPFTCQTREVTP